MKRIRFKYFVVSLFVLAPLFILIVPITSTIFSNLGQVCLNHIHVIPRLNSLCEDLAIEYFDSATQLDSQNLHAWNGLGHTYALLESDEEATSAWRQGNISLSSLLEYGNKAQKYKFYDLAILYYKAVSSLDPAEFSPGSYFAANICQLNLITFLVLNEQNTEFCYSYFDEADGNLIVNGQFNGSTIDGWQGAFFFPGGDQPILDIDEYIGVPSPSVNLTTKANDRSIGLYQKISLPASTEVRFGGWFKSLAGNSLNARILYIGWLEDGISQGNDVATLQDDSAWTYFERKFRVPENAESEIMFYPAAISGIGDVWIDEVKIEIIEN